MNESFTVHGPSFGSEFKPSRRNQQKSNKPRGRSNKLGCSSGHPLPEPSSSQNEPSMLPGSLANALVRAYEGLNDLSLTDNARRVLACLLRFGLSLNNFESKIFIKKITIAKKLDLSEATVYRALNALESAGLIIRDEQLKFKTISTIGFTKCALLKLGLTKERDSISEREQKGTDQKLKSSTLAPVQVVNSKPIQSFSKRQSQRAGLTRFGKQAVPSELAWLITEKGLLPNAVFGLMGIATKQGHRLSDVVEHASDAIRSKEVKNVFAYIRALISKNLDFQFLASELQAGRSQAAIAEERRQNIARAHDALQPLVGKTFEAPDGKHWTVEEGLLVTNDGRTRSAIPFCQAPTIVLAIADSVWPISRCSPNPKSELLYESGKLDAANLRAREVLGTLRRKLLRFKDGNKSGIAQCQT